MSDRREIGWLVLRAGLGTMMIWHGWPKLIDGPERWSRLGGAMRHFGIDFAPEMWGLAAALAECAGGALVAAGLFTRPAAAALVFTLFVAATKHYREDGFGEATHAIETGLGFLAILIGGSGRLSLDARLRGKS
jgi:putative oxidoreductase